MILVHGLAANQNDNWQTMAPYLADNGYCVFSFTYGNLPRSHGPSTKSAGSTDMGDSAHQAGGFVTWVLDATHARKVDIVGHSEGGTMPDYYIKFLGGSQVVAHFVMLSGVIHGTTFWGLSDLYDLAAAYGFSSQTNAFVGSFCARAPSFWSGSSFIKTLDAPNAEATPGDAATCPVRRCRGGRGELHLNRNRERRAGAALHQRLHRPRCANAGDGIGVDNIVVQHQCASDLADHLSIVSDQVAAKTSSTRSTRQGGTGAMRPDAAGIGLSGAIMRIAVTGSRGLIGSALTWHLRTQGHEIVPLVRGEPQAGEIRWDPRRVPSG